jgi:hypothetical protein
MKTCLMLAGACLALATAPAFAQTGATTVEHQDGSTTTITQSEHRDNSGTAGGAASGVIAGAVVAGPIGAVVGGIAGATIGHSVAPPREVRTYVTTQTPPATPAAYSGPVTVGRSIDGDVPWQGVPDYPKYSWAYMSGQRVVIDNDTHKVVAVY